MSARQKPPSAPSLFEWAAREHAPPPAVQSSQGLPVRRSAPPAELAPGAVGLPPYVQSGWPRVVSYGLGVDSTAVLVLLHRSGIRPDLILFADTGGERPETYAYLDVINDWLRRVGFPEVTLVRYTPVEATYNTLEANCLTHGMLPSLAYGGHMHGCSLKFKVGPMDAAVRRWKPAIEAWARGEQVVRIIGYDDSDADNERRRRFESRGGKNVTERFAYWYPLQVAHWNRARCIEEITREGLPVPPKSACTFCPATKPHEVVELVLNHPDLAWRVIELELHAAPNLVLVDGLWGAGTAGTRGGVPRPGSMSEYILSWMIDGRAYRSAAQSAREGVSAEVSAMPHARRYLTSLEDDRELRALGAMEAEGRAAALALRERFEAIYGEGSVERLIALGQSRSARRRRWSAAKRLVKRIPEIEQEFARVPEASARDRLRRSLATARERLTAAEQEFGDALTRKGGDASEQVMGEGEGLTVVEVSEEEVEDATALPTLFNGPGAPRDRCPSCGASVVPVRPNASAPVPPSFPTAEIGLMTQEEFLAFRNPEGKYHPQDSYQIDIRTMNDNIVHTGTVFSGRGDGINVLRVRDEPDTSGLLFADEHGIVGVLSDGILYHDRRWTPRGPITYRTDRDKYVDLPIASVKRVKYVSEYVGLVNRVAERNLREYPHLIQNLVVKGEPIQIRSEAAPGVNDGATLVALNAKKEIVAMASEEWGATLFRVVDEYRGSGIGQALGRLWYDLNPSFGSGGFTVSGEQNAIRLWGARVREFLDRGWYTELVRSGRITAERVREILADLPDTRRASPLPEPAARSVPSQRDIRFLIDPGVSFIIYDARALDGDQGEHPDEKYIYAYGFFRHDERVGLFLFRIDYDREFRRLATEIALQMARDEGEPLYVGRGYADLVEWEDIPDVRREGDYVSLTKDVFPIKAMSRIERLKRMPVDRYGQREALLVEAAEMKWQ